MCRRDALRLDRLRGFHSRGQIARPGGSTVTLSLSRVAGAGGQHARQRVDDPGNYRSCSLPRRLRWWRRSAPAASRPSADQSTPLDAHNCQDPDFYEENIEFCASEPGDSVDQPPDFAEVGESVPFTDEESGATGRATLNAVTWEPYVPQDSYPEEPPQNGGHAVGDFTIEVDPGSSGSMQVSVLNFNAQLNDGTVVRSASPAGLEGQINPGRMLRGQIEWDVPQGETILIDWESFLTSDILATWEVTT